MNKQIKPSERNTNRHTTDGMQLLDKSIKQSGVIESIATATDGTIITGHARHEIFVKNGLKPKFIKLEKDEFAVLETDIENNTKEYFEAQILANTTGNKNFDLDFEVIDVIAEEFDIDIEEVGVDVGDVMPEIDYDILNEEDVSSQLKDMTNGVKKAIQIEFEAEHYEEAYELVKFWRSQGDVGYMILQYLKAEKEKL